MGMVDYNRLDVGDGSPGLEVVFSVDDVRAFLKVAGDSIKVEAYFTDAAAAERDGFGSKPVVPGRMGFGYLERAVLDWMPEARLEKLDVVYRSPTFVDTKHVGKAVITDKVERGGDIRFELDVHMESEDGTRPYRGAAVVVIPRT